MKRSYAKQYFYSLGREQAKAGMSTMVGRRNRLRWPEWCRREWAAGFMQYATAAENGEKE